jgi:predicted dienelactone hydrolase
MILLIGLACTDPVTLPAPTGDLAIGEQRFHWADGDREEALTSAGGDEREVTVHLWYPASSDAGDVAPYVPELDSLKPVLDRDTKRVWKNVIPHAVLDAPVLDGEPFPLIVFSHGNDMIGAQYTFLIEELVSHGYAVSAVDHPYDARAVLLANGEPVPFMEDAWPTLPPPGDDGMPDPDSDFALFYRDRVEVRSADASFVLDTLAADDPVGLDFEHVGFAGHSVGGVTAGQFCQDDDRVDACVNLDGDFGGGPFYLQDGAAFDEPYLMLTKPFEATDDQLADWGLTRDEWEALIQSNRDEYFGAVTGGSWRVALDGATHGSFTDEPYVFAALEGDDTADAEEKMRLVRAHVLAFFDMVLRDEPTTLFDSPEDGVSVEAWP